MNPIKANVLGAEYEIAFAAEWEDPKLVDCGGYIDPTMRKIVVAVNFAESTRNVGDLSVYRREALRHELVHAFFRESGLWSDSGLGRNELLVDWIALQLPKMMEVIQKAGGFEN